MDFATTDLALAIAHHLLIFALAGIVAFEIAMVRPGIAGADMTRVARVDLWYGILAAVIVAVGFSRAVYAAKGWDYYAHNAFFWGKMGSFILVGLLSIVPTVRFIRWRRESGKAPGFAPAPTDIATVRSFLWLEVLGLAVVLACAAAMARGYGEGMV